jgi:hypothetical protein
MQIIHSLKIPKSEILLVPCILVKDRCYMCSYSLVHLSKEPVSSRLQRHLWVGRVAELKSVSRDS